MRLFFVMIALVNFIFLNLNIIALAGWLMFFCIVAIRTLRPSWVNNISYGVFVVGAICLHFLYGIVATFGQARAWAMSNDATRVLFAAPLPSEVPFPSYLEWAHPLFERTHGYFAFYSFEHFFLSTIALFVVAGLFFLFLVARARYRSFNFREGDIMLIVLIMLISGWPGIFVLLPIGLVSAVLLSVGARALYGVERITLPPAFLLAAPFALIFATPILTSLHLYSLLKL